MPSPATSFLRQNPAVVDFSRRRSVDVGVLGLGTHRNGVGSISRRVRDAVGPDAGDKETGFVGYGSTGGKDSTMGQHLAPILAHSLSLCAEPRAAELPPIPLPHPSINSDPLDAIPGSPVTSPSTSPNTFITDSSFSTAPSVLGSSPPSEDVAPPKQAKTNAGFPIPSEAKRFKLIGNLQSWSFNAMGYNSNELLSCVGIMFESVRDLEGVEFDLEQFKLLLLSLHSAYHSHNDYHNFSHATDPTQAYYSFLVRMGLSLLLCACCARTSTILNRNSFVM
ncbi:hypothetical protein MNV49_007519 [Pseudohyphozyma bogoriensis]|nr:hypothetical protein MNV49_007519 [Pseudohyphozyma bogoriensis]